MFDKNGKRLTKSFTAPTEIEAMRMACEYANIPLKSSVNIDMTVSQGIDEYIEIKSSNSSGTVTADNKACGLSPTTIRGYRAIQKTRLQSIMNIPMSQLTLKDIQKAVTIDEKRLSSKSIHDALSLVSTVLSWNDISLNMKRITYTKTPKIKDALPPYEKIYKAIKGSTIELVCLLASWRSLRMSEVRGLKFSDISSDGHYITVQRAKIYQDGNDIVKNITKTEGSTRKIPLPDHLYRMILDIPHTSDDDFIVPYGYKYINYHFKKLMRANGMPDMTFHKLRHVFATICSDLRIPENYTEKIGGWSNSKVLKDVYTHTTGEKEREYTDTIDDYHKSVITGGNRNSITNEKTQSKSVVTVKVDRSPKKIKGIKAVHNIIVKNNKKLFDIQE